MTSKILGLLISDYQKLNQSFEIETIGLSWIASELRKFSERIDYFISLASFEEEKAIVDLFLDLLFKFWACICYYGGGNTAALNYWHAAKYN